MIQGYAIAALLAAILAGGGVWKVQDWRYGAREADRLAGVAKSAKILERQGDNAAGALESDKSAIRTQFRTIYKDVDHVVEKPVYRNICLDDDGLRILTAATRAAPAASEPSAAVSRPITP